MLIHKQLPLAAVAAGALLASSVATAEMTANIGASSNYMWRGVTQTSDDAAISGGLDYAHDSGLYVGTWASSLGGGSQYEIDFYGGYAGEVGDFGYDVGVIYYGYPIGDDVEADFTEAYIGGSYAMISAQVAFTIDKEDDDADSGDLYYTVGADFEMPDDFGLSVYVGYYDFDAEDAEDYTHYGAAVSKSAGEFGDFTFAVDMTDLDNTDTDLTIEDPRVSVSWGKEF